MVVVDELEELPHPASPRVAAVSTTSDQVRKRGIGEVLSEDGGMRQWHETEHYCQCPPGQTVVATGPAGRSVGSGPSKPVTTPWDHSFHDARHAATGHRRPEVTLADLEPERLSGPDAARLLEAFAEIEKLAAAGRLLSARRVESSNVWRRAGHRSAAAHMAEATGTGLGPAINALEAARQLGSLPATDDAMRQGKLSESQVKEIAGAAILQPEAEQELVDAATQQPLSVLKLRCRRVKAVGSGPERRLRRHPSIALPAQLDRSGRCGPIRCPADARRGRPADRLGEGPYGPPGP